MICHQIQGFWTLTCTHLRMSEIRVVATLDSRQPLRIWVWGPTNLSGDEWSMSRVSVPPCDDALSLAELGGPLLQIYNADGEELRNHHSTELIFMPVPDNHAELPANVFGLIPAVFP